MLVGSCLLLLVCCGLYGQRLFIPSLRRREEERKREIAGIGESLLKDDELERVTSARVAGDALAADGKGFIGAGDIP